jgi:peptide/nickel transport system permease protein
MGRFSFIAWRVITLVPLLLGIMFVVFLLLKITPGDPAREAVGLRASPEAVAQASHAMGLDRSVPGQFLHYVGHAVQGDLGYSFKTSSPVLSTLADQAPVTLWLIVSGALVSLILAVPLATLAALRPDNFVDQGIRAVGVVALAMPLFWVGIMLITLIALPTGAFPVGGFGSGFTGHVQSIVLPALTLGIAMAPVMIRSLRTTIIGVLESEHVSAARALGVRGPRLLRRFVLRNGLPSMVTLLALQAGYFLFGAVVIETTFNLQGLGQGLVSAVQQRDFPLVQGYTLVFAVAIVVIYLLADVAVALLDPRVVIDG